MVLYVLVCGSLPFDGASLPALRQRVTEGRFRIPFFMSEGMCRRPRRRSHVTDTHIRTADPSNDTFLKRVPERQFFCIKIRPSQRLSSHSKPQRTKVFLPHTQSQPAFCLLADCENLIRKMLVVDPAKRISIAQIKQHRWMLADPSAPRQALSVSLSITDYNSNLGDYNESVLSIMQTLGIDRQRTIEVRGGRRGEVTVAVVPAL